MYDLFVALGHGAVYALVGGALLALAYFVLDLLTPGHLAQLFSDHDTGHRNGRTLGSHSAALVTSAWLLSTSLVIFTAIWTNGETSLGWAFLWTVTFSLLGILLNTLLFVGLEVVTPGDLRAAVCAPGAITPLAVVAAGIALASAGIVCASIA